MQRSAEKWSQDAVPRLSAAFSFYAILSLAPILVFAVTIGSIFVSRTQNHILHEAKKLFGQAAADLISQLLSQTRHYGAGEIATLSSLVISFAGATNLFLQLDDAMSVIWDVRPSGPFLHTLIFTRIKAFVGVLVLGAVFVSWLVLDSWINWASHHIANTTLWPFISFVSTTFIATVGFGISFKALAKKKIAWGDVWLGGLVTALGFAGSKYLLAEYFALARVSAAYGTAGALAVILLWAYYTSQIYFFGVEITHTYATRYGSLVASPQAATEKPEELAKATIA